LTAPLQQPEAAAQDQGAATVCKAAEDTTVRWCQIATGLALSSSNPQEEFRDGATPPLNAQLLYAGIFMPLHTFLVPGETDTFQRVVDIDPATVRLVRLSVSAVFLTHRNVKDMRSCWKSRASDRADPTAFANEVDTPEHFPGRSALPIIDPRMIANLLCVDYEFAPQNIIDEWIGDQGVLRVQIILNDPQNPSMEYPELLSSYYVINADGISLDDPDGRISNILQQRNPISGYGELPTEYAPGVPIKKDGKG
jgi:hypothetical protein